MKHENTCVVTTDISLRHSHPLISDNTKEQGTYKSHMQQNRPIRFFAIDGGLAPTPVNGADDDNAIEYNSWMRPPGLVGEIADFIYMQAYSPFFEAALAGAIAYLAGICGRAYNVDGKGLNLYIALLAPTSSGKQAAKDGIDALNAAVSRNLITTTSLSNPRVGPLAPESAQGLVKYLAAANTNEFRQCCLSCFGEFGMWLQKLTSKRADANSRNLLRLIMDLFTSSGKDRQAGGSAYSDSNKNVPILIAPAWSFIGDSTQQEFYKAVDEDNVTNGLMGRMLTFEYSGPLPEINSSHNVTKPSDELIKRVVELLNYATEIEKRADNSNEHQWINVTFDAHSEQALKELRSDIRKQQQAYNDSNQEHLSGLIGRSVEKLIKVATLLAVGINPYSPVVTMREFVYARLIVERSNQYLIRRFETGKVGEVSYYQQQRVQLIGNLNAYIKKDWKQEWKKRFGITQEMKVANVISRTYFDQYVITSAAFSKSPSPKLAFDNIIKEFVEADYLCPVSDTHSIRGDSKAKLWHIKSLPKQ